MRILMILLLVLQFNSSIGQGLEQKPIDKYVWDLSLIYTSDEAWETDVKWIQQRCQTISEVKGYMTASPKELARAMDAIYELRSRAAKAGIYAQLRSDVDTQDQRAASMAVVGPGVERLVETSVSFLSDEIRKIGADRLKVWISQEPSLVRHSRRINRIVRELPHISSAEIESITESMKGWPRVSGEGYFSFTESDFDWPKYVASTGKEQEITYSNYRQVRRSPDAKERREIPIKFLQYANAHRGMLGFLLTQRIEADKEIARLKKFDDGIDARWFLRDGFPEGTYKTMINAAQKNKEILNRFTKTLEKLLNLEKIEYQDFYALPKSSKTFPIEEAWPIIFGAIKPLGDSFVEKVKAEASKPTLHLTPLPGKRTFYANQMPIAGMPSYTMLTYRGTMPQLRALMGSVVGKARYSEIPKVNCPDTRDDPPVYGNGMLYITEMILTDYLVGAAKSKEEKLFYLHDALFRLWQVGFAEAMNAELEAKIQQMVVNNMHPTGAQISEVYLSLLRSYYPNISIDPAFGNEWMVNSVPFGSYEAQFWVGSLAFACQAFNNFKAGKKGADLVVTQSLMGKGQTDLSHDMLLSIGIDLTQEKSYQAMYDRMQYLLDEVDKLLK